MEDKSKEPIEELIAVESLNYEQAYAELEGIVAALESGEHTLERSLALFARGQELARHCTNLLDQAELQIQQIAGEKLIPFTATE
jgi:exodeoxyribonuclease VII small subunit